MEKKEKLKEIRKIIDKIEKMENKIRRRSKTAWFDRRYTKTGSLSDSCCQLDDLKLELFELNEQLEKLIRTK